MKLFALGIAYHDRHQHQIGLGFEGRRRLLSRDGDVQYLTITFLVLAFCALQAGAADLKIIANPSVGATSVSAEELKGVFLATKVPSVTART
jgi:hypothetical protein